MPASASLNSFSRSQVAGPMVHTSFVFRKGTTRGGSDFLQHPGGETTIDGKYITTDSRLGKCRGGYRAKPAPTACHLAMVARPGRQ